MRLISLLFAVIALPQIAGAQPAAEYVPPSDTQYIFTYSTDSSSRVVAVPEGDICASDRLKKILEAIECKKTNCPDPDGLFDRLYKRACMDISSEGLVRARILVEEETDDGASPPPLLSPCDCLAKLKEKTNCDIELCKPPAPPAEPAPPPPAPPAEPGKEAVGDRAPFALEGGSRCSLNPGVAFASGFQSLGLLLLSPLWLGYRRLRKNLD